MRLELMLGLGLGHLCQLHGSEEDHVYPVTPPSQLAVQVRSPRIERGVITGASGKTAAFLNADS